MRGSGWVHECMQKGMRPATPVEYKRGGLMQSRPSLLPSRPPSLPHFFIY